jgi:hypothetical protein
MFLFRQNTTTTVRVTTKITNKSFENVAGAKVVITASYFGEPRFESRQGYRQS